MSKFKKIISTNDSAVFEELGLDKRSARMVYEVASTCLHNTLVEVARSETKHWEHLIETYQLDPRKEYLCDFDKDCRRWVIMLKEEQEE